jgi:hypothetical protein
MADNESQPGEENRETGSAAPSDEGKVVGENADLPAGEGEEADEAGVEGGDGAAQASGEPDADSGSDEDDDRDPLAKEIEADPASNPDDPLLREVKGG